MKQLFLFIIVLFVSCSKGEDSVPPLNLQPKLIHKLIGPTVTETYYYTGNKIDSIVSNVLTKHYEYSGDFITKETYIRGGVVDYINTYSYTNSRLAQYESKEPTGELRYGVSITYPTTDSDIEFYSDDYAPPFARYYDDLGRVIKTQQLNKDGTVYSEEQYVSYEYDDKHTPHKNILGYYAMGRNISSINNLIRSFKHNGGLSLLRTSYVHIYDDDGYPVQTIYDDSFTITYEYKQY